MSTCAMFWAWRTVFFKFLVLSTMIYLLFTRATLFVMQATVFRCWSSKTSTDPHSSTVRGRSLKSDSATREATTGSATNDYISWHIMAATSWGLICRRMAISAGPTPSTVPSPYSTRLPITRWRFLGTRVTQEMHFRTTTGWCLQPMIVTMTCGTIHATTLPVTVQREMAVDSGTGPADPRWWTVSLAKGVTSDGMWVEEQNIHCCSRLACGWYADYSTGCRWNLPLEGLDKQNESASCLITNTKLSVHDFVIA